MSEYREFPENSGEHEVRAGASQASGERRALIHDRRFRLAWAASVFLHVLLFAWVSMAPSQPKYRFFGSGTAVNLVGADEIPGGSARGKSGDRPEDMESPSRLEGPAEGARKIAAPRKKPAPPKKAGKKKVVKKVKKKAPPAKKSVVRKKAPPKKARRIAVGKSAPKKKKVVRGKKKRDPAREARLKRMRERRARAERWRRNFRESGKSAPASKRKKPRAGRAGDERLAKANLAPRRRAPLRGYPGEGGGDGQGGGSRGGGGGAARTEMERYYGLLGERISSYWTLPLTLSDVGGMKAEITIDVNREGGYRNLRIHRSSGNRIYDQAALRAAERAFKSAPPRPPDAIKENWLFLGFRFCGEKGVC